MKKLNTWETLPPTEQGELKDVVPGAYHCVITAVSSGKSRVGNNMIVLELDIADGQYAGAYSSSQYPPRLFLVTGIDDKGEVSDQKALSRFEGSINAIEKSNPNYELDWDETTKNFDYKTLLGKHCCVAFGESERYGKDGRIYTDIKPRWLRSLDALREGRVETPSPEKVKPGTGVGGVGASGGAGTDGDTNTKFANIGEPVSEDDTPF